MTKISNQFTLGPGEYEIRSTSEDKYVQTKITKISDYTWLTPKHTLWERFLYLFTGKLKNVTTIKEYVNRNKNTEELKELRRRRRRKNRLKKRPRPSPFY